MKKIILLKALVLLSLNINSQVQLGQGIEGVNNPPFVSSVSLSSDSSILAAGAANNMNSNGVMSGQVQIFTIENNVWVELGSFIDGENEGDLFGFKTLLSKSGAIVAVGAPKSDATASDSGQVTIYELQGDAWVPVGNPINGEAEGDEFGSGLSLSADGSIVAISSPKNDANGEDSGQVKVYQNQANSWVQIGQNIDGEAAGDELANVSLSNDGTILAVSFLRNDENGSNSGKVKIFENVSNTWTQVGGDILGDNVSDEFGQEVSLSADGNTIAISSIGDDTNGSNAGIVKIFRNEAGQWVQIGDSLLGENSSDVFGQGTSLSGDGNTVAIGAPFNRGGGFFAGRVQIYTNSNDNWVQVGENIDGSGGNQLGVSVYLTEDANTVAIGAQRGVIVYSIDNILSTEENSFSEKLKLYPNPTSYQLNVEIPEDILIKETKLFNSLGQLIKEFDDTKNIILSSYSKGVYFIEFTTNKGNKIMENIVID